MEEKTGKGRWKTWCQYNHNSFRRKRGRKSRRIWKKTTGEKGR